MHTLTAIIRAKPGSAPTVLKALQDCAELVRRDEPDTVSFFVTQDAKDEKVFVTHERFVDEAAMERHNNGPASKGFFAAAGHLIDGPVTVVIGAERAAKTPA